MATSFSSGRSRSTRREPPAMGKQLVNFITCGCESIDEVYLDIYVFITDVLFCNMKICTYNLQTTDKWIFPRFGSKSGKMYVSTVCSVNVTKRVDPIEVFKLVCTGRIISSRRSMVYMSKFILIYGLLELFGICLSALESIYFLIVHVYIGIIL